MNATDRRSYPHHKLDIVFVSFPQQQFHSRYICTRVQKYELYMVDILRLVTDRIILSTYISTSTQYIPPARSVIKWTKKSAGTVQLALLFQPKSVG